jgi:predicted methyltransferase
MSPLKSLALAIPLLGLLACHKSPQEAAAPALASELSTESQPAAAMTMSDAGAIDAAIANPNRLAGDKDEDGWRKPAAVLNYLELRPGMHAIDYLAGGGYYSELMSYVVGPQGQVVAYNNPAYLKYAAEKPAERYGNNRLPNVMQLTTAPEELPLDPSSIDAALFVLSYHDLHWKSKDGSWPPTDPAKALAKLVPALKPGATVVVIDHIAAAGGNPDVTVDALHRIDPAVIKREFEAAGLVFNGASTEFRNPADDHTKAVFDDSIRHKTDRVMYKFKKR